MGREAIERKIRGARKQALFEELHGYASQEEAAGLTRGASPEEKAFWETRRKQLLDEIEENVPNPDERRILDSFHRFRQVGE